MKNRRRNWISASTLRCAAATWVVGSLATVSASPLLGEVKLVSDANVVASAVPAPQSFTIATTGSYAITIKDLGSPAALSLFKVAVATPTALAAQLSAAGTMQSQTVTLQAGTYTVQALATAAPAPAIGGTYNIQVAPAGGGSVIWSYQGAVGPANPPPSSGTSVLQSKLTAVNTGTYTFKLSDAQFPQLLSTVELVAIPEGQANPSPVMLTPTGGGTAAPYMILTPTGSAPTATATGTLSSNTVYDIIAFGTADAPLNAGLFAVQVQDPNNSPVALSQASSAVGLVPAPISVSTSQAETLSVKVTDLQYPAALTLLKAIVLQNGAVVVPTFGIAGSTQTVPAAVTMGSVQLYVWGQGGSGQGSYAAYATEPSGNVLADVAAPITDASHFGYVYSASLLTAGSYQLTMYDFKQPTALASLVGIVEQQGTAQIQGSGTLTLSSAQSGAINVLMFPTLASTTANSLFGAELAATGSGAPALEITQGVGALFSSSQTTISNTGSYLLQVSDLGFPAPFSAFTVILTSGQTVVGQFGGSGSKIFSVPTSGSYVVNVLANVAGNGADYGLYGVNLDVAPAAPTATLATSSTSIVSGGTVTLTWSSAGAASCTASAQPAASGWTGTLATLSGQTSSGALTASTVFSLVCADSYGRSATASVSVEVTAASSSSGGSSGGGGSGGGGALTLSVLLTLSLLMTSVVRQRQRQ